MKLKTRLLCNQLVLVAFLLGIGRLNAQLIVSASFSGFASFNPYFGDPSSFYVRFGFVGSTQGGTLRGELFRYNLITTNSTGQVFQANAQNSTNFGIFTTLLTDGVQDIVWSINTSGDLRSYIERDFFNPLPNGSNGIDLEGYAITNVTMTVNSVVLSYDQFNNSNYTYNFTYRVYGFPTPKLIIAPQGTDQMKISWSTNAPGFVLQETTNLVSPLWINSTSGVTNPAISLRSGTSKYFRLIKP